MHVLYPCRENDQDVEFCSEAVPEAWELLPTPISATPAGIVVVVVVAVTVAESVYNFSLQYTFEIE